MSYYFFTYLALGPLLWFAVAFGLASSRIRFAKLKNSTASLPPNPPHVTILIPAHNEGPGLQDCLNSVLALDYPSYNIILIDDRSTDASPALMDRLATYNPRLTVIHLTSKPTDWLGKCHALHIGSQQTTSPWLLFIDSDVTVTPDALSKTLAFALQRQSDALSILTRQRCDTFTERLVTPIACAAILGMYLASLTNDDSYKTAFANGQFFLIRREPYLAIGGHESVKQLPCEDIDLMRFLKKSGAKTRLYAGDHLATTRFYDSLKRMFKGWARIYSGASHRRPWRILVACVFVLSGLFAFIAPILLPAFSLAWYASLVHLITVLISLSFIYIWSGNSPAYALLFPLAAPMQLAFYAHALYWCATNKMTWRGTPYATGKPKH